MGKKCGTTHARDCDRRALLRASVVVATLAAVGGRHGSHAHAAALTSDAAKTPRQRPCTVSAERAWHVGR